MTGLKYRCSREGSHCFVSHLNIFINEIFESVTCDKLSLEGKREYGGPRHPSVDRGLHMGRLRTDMSQKFEFFHGWAPNAIASTFHPESHVKNLWIFEVLCILISTHKTALCFRVPVIQPRDYRIIKCTVLGHYPCYLGIVFLRGNVFSVGSEQMSVGQEQLYSEAGESGKLEGRWGALV